MALTESPVMHSWEVVCVDVDSDTDITDCQSITNIGYLVANSVKELDPNTAALMIEKNQKKLHISQEDREIPVKKAGEGMDAYVRTLDRDSSEDPLLKLPTIEEYHNKEKREQRGF